MTRSAGTEPEGLSPELATELEVVERDAWEDLYRAAPAETADRLGIRVWRRGSVVTALARELEALAMQRPLGLGVEEPADAAALDWILDRHRATGSDTVFLPLAPRARPAAIRSWLRARGFGPYNRWIKFYRSTDDPPPLPRIGLGLLRAGPEAGDAVGRVIATAFDMDDGVRPWFAALAGRTGWATYLALDSDVPVAAATLRVGGGTAWAGFGATLPEHRGRGAQQLLLAARVRDAAEEGCRRIVLETGEEADGRPIGSGRNALRTGFRAAYRRTNYLLRL